MRPAVRLMAAELRAPRLVPRRRSSSCSASLFAAALVHRRPRARTASRARSTARLTTTTQDAILIVSLIAAPLFFLVGLGAFDYWFYWAAGRPTRPEDHSEPRRALAGRTTSGSTPITR